MTKTEPPNTSLRVLLVGAGSVGQVYGHHFQRGGAEVRYLVRPKYVEQCRAGFTLHHFVGRRTESSKFLPNRVSASPEEAAQGGVDLVVLCMSYSGLRGEWLNELLTVVGDVPVLSLVPGIAAREWLGTQIPPDRP